MKRIYGFFLFLLLIAACSPKTADKKDNVPENRAVLIDFPAVVVIKKNHNADMVSKLSKSLPDFVEIIDSASNEYVFVKNNGDRVSIEVNTLQSRYDVVIFNRINNPIPCKIQDIARVVSSSFENRKIYYHQKNADIAMTHHQYECEDTIPLLVANIPFSPIERKAKRIVLELADTTSSYFEPRTIIPVQWVLHRIDTRKVFGFTFENDLITYANTDRYFTNGVSFELQSPGLSKIPISKLMMPFKFPAIVTYKLSMYQDMFTPTDTRVAPKLDKDRPYASYLYFSYQKSMANSLRKLRLTSAFDLGYLGPHSPGSYMQKLVHATFPTNDVPIGWETQINTDIILNYKVKFDKEILSSKNTSLSSSVQMNAGTLHTSAGVGMCLLAGKYESPYSIIDIKKRSKTELYFFAKTDITLVGYNALLQGGMLNRDNVFTLQPDQISRIVGSGQVGIRCSYKSTGIEIAQHYLSPEYKGGLWHKWGRITAFFKL